MNNLKLTIILLTGLLVFATWSFSNANNQIEELEKEVAKQERVKECLDKYTIVNEMDNEAWSLLIEAEPYLLGGVEDLNNYGLDAQTYAQLYEFADLWDRAFDIYVETADIMQGSCFGVTGNAT